MPRKKRQESPTGVYHWIVRGMNKKNLFHDPTDYEQFKSLLAEYKSVYLITIYHYCLMTNHVHVLLRAEALEKLSKFSHFVQRKYAYYYCKKYKWTGSVFQRGFKNVVVDRDEYLLECGRYIERNPVKAKLADLPKEYRYSSFRYYAEGEDDSLITPSPAFEGLSASESERSALYANYVEENRIQEEMAERGLLPV